VGDAVRERATVEACVLLSGERSPARKLQHALTIAFVDRRNTDALKRQLAANGIGRARLADAAGKHASLALTTVPTDVDLELEDGEWIASTRDHLGMPFQYEGSYVVCVCGARVTDDPGHPHSCPLLRRAGVLSRHNLILHSLRVACTQLGYSTRVEPGYRMHEDADGVADDHGRRKVPDLSVVGPNFSVLIDVSVAHMAAQSHLNTPAATVIEQRERQKHRLYDLVARAARSQFVPFVVSSRGQLGKEALVFLKSLARHAVLPPHEEAAFRHRVMRTIAVAIQKGNALLVLSWLTRQVDHIVRQPARWPARN
jgi:hypothetical protein